MGWFDFLRRPAPGLRAPANDPYGTLDQARKLAGGRLSNDNPNLVYASNTLIPPATYEEDWRTFQLDSQTLTQQPALTVMRMLIDLSPDVGKAVWDFLRMCNPGWSYTVGRNTTTTSAHVKGNAALDAFFAYLDSKYGSVDVIWQKLFLGGYTRGGFFSEIILDSDGRTPLDIVTPDPATARFRPYDDPKLGKSWELGQLVLGQFVSFIDRPTILYIPIDPFPGEPPYGRPPMSPSLFSSLFLLGLLHDLRRVISQQGYPRMDIAIVLEKLAEMMPQDLENNPEAFKKWVENLTAEVKAVYATLQPDDAYIHTDVVAVSTVGTADANSLGGIGAIIAMLERMCARALKTMPIMMGITDSVSEANANRQWEIMAAGVKYLQTLCAKMISRQLTLVLQAQGIQGVVSFEFKELRRAEAYRDEQTRMMLNQNVITEYIMGWRDNTESSNLAVGHDPVSDPIALPLGRAIQETITGGAPSQGSDTGGGGAINQAQTNPDPTTTANG
jgi:hypothetical protein